VTCASLLGSREVTALLLPAISGAEVVRGFQVGERYVPPEQICELSKFQDGDGPHYLSSYASGRLVVRDAYLHVPIHPSFRYLRVAL
jgi:hypothetical protein